MGSNRSKTVVLGTVYPALANFLADYGASLLRQTCNEFDLLIANDGLDDAESRFAEIGVECRIFDVSGTIPEIRRKLIDRAITDGYDKVVFTDCDDILADNRVERVTELLETSPIVVNDLDLADASGEIFRARYFASRFEESAVFDEKAIRQGNCLGLSNTAARVATISEAPALARGEPLAFDWYLWASTLDAGLQAVFTSETATRYRVYDDSFAGMPQALDEHNIRRGIEVKYLHYQLMRKIAPVYDDLYREFDGLRSSWTNEKWRKRYIDALRDNAMEIHMWWENIRRPTEVGIA